MAVERLTDYTRRIWTALDADAPEGHDIHVNDVIYYMDSSQCGIVTYVYPEGSIDVEFLPDIGGGGGGGDYVASDWLDKTKPAGGAVLTYNGTDAPPTIATRTGTFSVVMPNCTTLSNDQQFARGCTGLTGVTAPNLTAIQPSYVFSSTTSWTGAAFFPKAIISGNAFRGSSVSVAVFLRIASSNSSAFQDDTNLQAVDQTGRYDLNGANSFSGCTSLGIVVLRSTTLVTLGNINNFTNTKFASGKAGGTLYVPQALIDSYKSATNWSVILGYGNGEQNQILPIEGSIYETQYADGTPIP